MKHISATWIFVLAALISSCADKALAPEREATQPLILQEITNAALDSFLLKMVSEEHFKGVVLAKAGGKVLHAKGYGMATETTPNSVSTKFHVASITKQFTATGIMQLLEAGKIDLEQSINKFLPLKYTSKSWDNVTIHHLLSHTSGIEDYALTRDYYDVEKGFCLGNTVDGMLKEAMGKELKFTPGSQFSYSNIGFTLLGHIIEQQSEMAYHQYIQTQILEPLGMNSSFIHTPEYAHSAGEALGYRWDDELNKHVFDDVVSLPVTEADGGLVTTLADFLTWTSIYTDSHQEILEASSLSKMTTPYIENGFRSIAESTPSYGYGLSLADGIISHPGYIVGFRSHFIVDTKAGLKVLVFSNNVSKSPKNVSIGIYEILRAE
ncbi:MAG: serine hydrolase domain-containing protein [Saprospiraceae bacterium]